MYVCMYIYIYTHTCTYVYIYIYITVDRGLHLALLQELPRHRLRQAPTAEGAEGGRAIICDTMILEDYKCLLLFLLRCLLLLQLLLTKIMILILTTCNNSNHRSLMLCSTGVWNQ